MKEIRLEIKARNNLILKRIEDAGFRSIKQFCERHGLAYSTVASIIALRMRPYCLRWVGEDIPEVVGNSLAPWASKSRDVRDVRWRKIVCDIADALGCLPEDLFGELTTEPLERSKMQMELDAAQVQSLVLHGPNPVSLPPDSEFFARELSAEISKVVGTLREREAEVIRLRFVAGLSLEETAKKMGYATRERVRQIESVALRKLKHPTRASRLRPYLDT